MALRFQRSKPASPSFSLSVTGGAVLQISNHLSNYHFNLWLFVQHFRKV